METKSSGIAIVLSFFWTGLGQLYGGRIGRGLMMMAATPILWILGWVFGFAGLMAQFSSVSATAKGFSLGGILIGVVPVAYWIWGMVDAKKICEAHNRSATGITGAPALQ